MAAQRVHKYSRWYLIHSNYQPFSENWRIYVIVAHTSPLFMQQDPGKAVLNNHRPVSNLPCLNKTIERCWWDCLLKFHCTISGNPACPPTNPITALRQLLHVCRMTSQTSMDNKNVRIMCCLIYWLHLTCQSSCLKFRGLAISCSPSTQDNNDHPQETPNVLSHFYADDTHIFI